MYNMISLLCISGVTYMYSVQWSLLIFKKTLIILHAKYTTFTVYQRYLWARISLAPPLFSFS